MGDNNIMLAKAHVGIGGIMGNNNLIRQNVYLGHDFVMGSLTLSSLNFMTQASVNDPTMVIKLAKEMVKRGIKPELEAFDTGMVNYSKYLIKKELRKHLNLKKGFGEYGTIDKQ